MDTLENKKANNITLGLNIVSVLMLVFAMFNIYTSNKYIVGLVVQGFDPAKEIVEVIKFYLNAVTPYVFYAICLFVLGIIVTKIDDLLYNRENKVERYKVYEEKQIVTEEDIVEMLLKEKST